jgi:hypothetical protein
MDGTVFQEERARARARREGLCRWRWARLGKPGRSDDSKSVHRDCNSASDTNDPRGSWHVYSFNVWDQPYSASAEIVGNDDEAAFIPVVKGSRIAHVPGASGKE